MIRSNLIWSVTATVILYNEYVPFGIYSFFSNDFNKSSFTLALILCIYMQYKQDSNKYRYNEHVKRIISVCSLAWLKLSSTFVHVFLCCSIVLATNQLANITAFYPALKSASECCFGFLLFCSFLSRLLLPLHPQCFPASKRCLVDMLLKKRMKSEAKCITGKAHFCNTLTSANLSICLLLFIVLARRQNGTKVTRLTSC